MDKCKTRLGHNAIPPPYTRNFMPPKHDLVYPSLDDFVDVNESISESIVEKPTVETNEPKTAKKEDGALIIEDWVSESKEEDVPKIKSIEIFNKPSFARDPPFSSSSKYSPDAGFKPSGEEEKKDAEDPRNKKVNVPRQKSQELIKKRKASVTRATQLILVSPLLHTLA
ncbi:hypothetical protein Tco_0300788 [Tanacetum coccineum]